MTITEAFDSLEKRCEEIGVIDEFGEPMGGSRVLAKVVVRFSADDEMLMACLSSGEISPREFEHSYMSLVLQFNLEYKMKRSVNRIRGTTPTLLGQDTLEWLAERLPHLIPDEHLHRIQKPKKIGVS